MSAAVRLVEVGPRDGLQSLPKLVPLEAKVAFINALSLAGLAEIESGAFVHPGKVPQMADSERVFELIERRKGTLYSALVPNERGFERALSAKADKISVFTAATETFNQKNIGATLAQSLERFKPVFTRAAAAGLPARCYVSTAFWCPYEGRVKVEAVVDVVRRVMDLSSCELSIGDTIGKAEADDVRRLLDELLKILPVERLFLHLHDTYGKAVANALAAWKEFGVTGFDASTGGVGGCPFAPGAAGNVATEQLVEAFLSAGARSSVDLAALKAASVLARRV